MGRFFQVGSPCGGGERSSKKSFGGTKCQLALTKDWLRLLKWNSLILSVSRRILKKNCDHILRMVVLLTFGSQIINK